MRNIALLLCLFAAPALVAQPAVVSPRHRTSAEANSNNVFPFGTGTSPFRYLQAHDDLAGTPRLIRRLSTRRDAEPIVAGDRAGYTLTMSIWLSTAARPALALDTNFDNNHGADKMLVLNSKNINYPASSTNRIPEEFLFAVPFDQPFVYLGQGPLCFEVQRTAHTGSVNAAMDYCATTAAVPNPPLPSLFFGTGCRLGVLPAMQARGDSVMNWPNQPGILRVTGANGPSSSFVLALVGFSSDTAFGSVRLPFSLPGSANAPSGECFLHVDPFLGVTTPTDASGASTTDIPVPADPNLNGLSVYTQLTAVDLGANPLGLVTSNAVGHSIVAPYGPTPGSRMWASGNLNATGTIRANQLLVVRFD